MSIKRRIVTGIAFIAAFLMTLVFMCVMLFRSYTITADPMEGSDPIVMSYNINSGDIDLGIPKRDGYRFVGWIGSNGEIPQRNLLIGSGTIGDLNYTAVWSDELNVTCEDWMIDSYGNRISDVSAAIDSFLKDGKSSKGYEYRERTMQCRAGEKTSAEIWGADKAYKAYSDRYSYIGSSGSVVIENDETVVYRYFYPVFDVNYRVDGEKAEDNEQVAVFSLKVDGEMIASGVSDFCRGIPYGAEYEIVDVVPMEGYRYEPSVGDSGTMTDDRLNIELMFYRE